MNIFELVVLQPIFNLLIAIYSIMPWGDFGIAIIIFTILIRFLLYPLVRRQLHQTKAMRKLAPELKKIREKHKKDRQAQSLAMMELYKRHGVSPFRSIGLLLIQLPIFIGLFLSIRVFTDHRQDIGKYTYDFLEQFGPIKHLIEKPDQFNETMLGVIDLTKHAIGQHGIDIILVALALLSAVTQYIMSKQTLPKDDSQKKFSEIMREAAEGKQADQSEINAIVMQNMVKFMPIMLFAIMLNLPGALALYYTVSNLIAVVQQHVILQEDEDELEEIADEAVNTAEKSNQSSAKNRSKNAKQAHITRITATDNKRGPKKRR